MNIATTIINHSPAVGMVLMTAAVTLGMLELPEHSTSKAAIVAQPAYALAGYSGADANPLRREKDESAPHYISYSVSQRTPGRSGHL